MAVPKSIRVVRQMKKGRREKIHTATVDADYGEKRLEHTTQPLSGKKPRLWKQLA